MQNQPASRSPHTRDEIITAALQLFIQHGFHGTSMRQIAASAGVALGNIYNYFSSKEEIFLVVLLKYHPVFDILPALESAQGETVNEILRDAASRIVDNIDQRKQFLNLMFIEMVEFKGEHVPKLFEKVFPQILSFAQRALQGRPELRLIPVPIMLRAFIGLFFSYLITEMLVGKQMSPEMKEDDLEQFVDIFLHGILKDSPAMESL